MASMAMRRDYACDDLKRLRRKQAARRKKILEQSNTVIVYGKIFYLIGLLCISLALATSAVCIFMRQYYQSALEERDQEIAELQLENAELQTQVDSFAETYNDTVELLEQTAEIAYELDIENQTLVDQANELQETINFYTEREELHDKYEWAIMREDNTRTDITYERITSLEELVGEKGLADDSVDLILSLAMSESRGIETAANPESSARGFGQMLEGTARYTYETLMGNGKGTYRHDMAFNGDLNLAMMTYYLDYLGIKYNDNIDSMLTEYRGEDDPGYNRKINKYLAKAGTDLHSIAFRP